MEIVFRCKEPSGALKEAVRNKLGHLDRFLEGLEAAEVRFLEDSTRIPAEREVCEVTLSGHGHHVRARACAGDHLAALDMVAAKLSHQLTKLKGRLLRRSHPRRTPAEVGAGSSAVQDGEVEVIEADGHANVVRVKQFDLKPMSLEEATLQLSLLGHSFYLFHNAESGRPSVLYRRRDGQLGLIEAS